MPPVNLEARLKRIPPTLNFASKDFDPVKALKSNQIFLPFPKAKIYNNIAEYYSFTFLKKGVNNDKVEPLKPKERNYAWYYPTLGLRRDGTSAATSLQRKKDNRKKRKGKKPYNVTYTPGSPMRSKRVLNLKSAYNSYWKRKRLQFHRLSSNRNVDTIECYADEEPIDLSMKSRRKEVTVNSESTRQNEVSVNSESILIRSSEPVSCLSPTRSGGSVLRDFDKSIDSLKWTEVLIPRTLRGLTLFSKRKCIRHVLQKYEHSFVKSCLKKAKARKQLVIDAQATHHLRRRNYYAAKTDTEEPLQKSVVEDPNCSRSLFNSSLNENILTSSENYVLCDNTVKAFSLAVKIRTPKHPLTKINKQKIVSKNLPKKISKSVQKNAIPGCTCNVEIVPGLSNHCSCGWYSMAIKNVQKFKIPKKSVKKNLP